MRTDTMRTDTMRTDTMRTAVGAADDTMKSPSRHPEPQPLVFVHVPKTAGTTLKKVFARQYGHESLFKTQPEEDLEGTVSRLRDLDRAERQRVRLIQGHMPFGIHEALGAPVRYVTMLRNPVDRMVSHYYYARRIPDHYLYDAVHSMSLREYVETSGGGISLEMDNGQVRSIAGAPHHLVEAGECSREMLDMAKRNLALRFDAVGILERFDESLLVFRRAFDWRIPLYIRRNVTKDRPSVREIDDQTLAIIEEHNRYDLELYRFAVELFDSRIRDLGPVFQAEIHMFKLLNNAYNRMRPARDRWLRFRARPTSRREA